MKSKIFRLDDLRWATAHGAWQILLILNNKQTEQLLLLFLCSYIWHRPPKMLIRNEHRNAKNRKKRERKRCENVGVVHRSNHWKCSTYFALIYGYPTAYVIRKFRCKNQNPFQESHWSHAEANVPKKKFSRDGSSDNINLIINWHDSVLLSHAKYKMQIGFYLCACTHAHVSPINLWEMFLSNSLFRTASGN